jgi:tRNA modification GTPase
MSDPASTIFAPGAGVGKAAIAIIRLSGPQTPKVVESIAGTLPPPRVARYAALRDPDGGELLDRGIVLFFPAPASATGEDYAEFQIHGGQTVVEAVLAALSRQPGLRPAEPGEFVRRGFVNGKLDLSQAEALADLIEAQTQAQRRQALRLAGGALRRKVEAWRAALIDALALVEAALDFSDEADVEDFDRRRLAELLAPIREDMSAALAEHPASERMREGFRVMILGPPNAGKSTLINALTRRDLAIVSPRAGTTRDMIEAHLEVDGLPVTVVDTAGLRDAVDEIEKIGVDRVFDAIGAADLAIWLSPEGLAPPDSVAGDIDILHVASKCDLVAASPGWLPLCAPTGEGLERLLAEISARARARLGDGHTALFARARHRSATQITREAIVAALSSPKPLELVAEDLRRAAWALGKIVGSVDVEDILDAVFSRFCIGK